MGTSVMVKFKVLERRRLGDSLIIPCQPGCWVHCARYDLTGSSYLAFSGLMHGNEMQN